MNRPLTVAQLWVILDRAPDPGAPVMLVIDPGTEHERAGYLTAAGVADEPPAFDLVAEAGQ